jgi:two-component system sensor histidine kinase QseC
VVTWATSSLMRASREIEEREPGRLTPISVDRSPREIQGIVKAVNGLLLRLSETLARERRFTADAAHELRTPVAALKVHAHNLRGARSELERVDSQRQLDASVQRVERLVDQLLTLSRMEPGTRSTLPVRLDLRELASNQLSDHQRIAAARGIELELDADGVAINADRNAIDAMLRNLIDNAIRYSPHGGRVRVGIRQGGDQAFVLVEDSGPGIPVESRQKVFERFHRELGNDVEGSGLGLSIVAQVLESHRGTIELGESDDLGGLKATVTLPAT